MAFLLSFLLGCVDGLRSLTAPAIMCWAAHLGWLHFAGTKFAFIDHRPTLSGVHAAGHYRAGRGQAPEHPGADSTCGPDRADCFWRAKRSGPRYRGWRVRALGGGDRLIRCNRWGVCRVSHPPRGSVQGARAGPRLRRLQKT